MAKTTKLVAVLLLALLALSMIATPALAGHNRYGPGSVKQSQCPKRCGQRCGNTQYHSACMFFCQKCCRKCLCVPPGYYGNKRYCPCYDNWKTKEGGPKCP